MKKEWNSIELGQLVKAEVGLWLDYYNHRMMLIWGIYAGFLGECPCLR